MMPVALVLGLGSLAFLGLTAGTVMLVRRTSLATLDARLRERSPSAWIAFRAAASALAALGLLCWVGLWFQRSFWLGVAQALMCGSVLANELGLLRRLRGGPQSLP